MDLQSKRALAVQAKDAEALRALAEEHDIAMTEREAQALFDRLHPTAGELSDDELEAVSGGGGGGGGGSSSSGFLAKGYQFILCPQCGYNYWTYRSCDNVGPGKTRFIWECVVCDHRAKERGGGEVPSYDTMYDVSKIETPREAWINE